MFRKDYLLRLIEEMTQVIGKIYGLKEQRKPEEALTEIDEWLTREFRLNSNLLRSLSSRDVVKLFETAGGMLEADKLQSAARMLEEEADIYDRMGRKDEGNALRAKVLHMYFEAALHEADARLYALHERIAQIQAELKKYRLPDETERLRFEYAKQQGRYAEAEDGLYRLLKRKAADYQEGLLFYEWLLAKDTAELERGDLPLDEVREGLAELQLLFAPPGTAERW